MYKCKHFDIKELVSKKIYETYGDFCWKIFNEQVLKDLDTIREQLKLPITINNWHLKGSFSQCGYRSNIDPIVKAKSSPYMSAHCFAIGFDLHCSDNKKLFELCKNLINTNVLKAFKRLESPITTKYGWVHIDGMRADKLEIF